MFHRDSLQVVLINEQRIMLFKLKLPQSSPYMVMSHSPCSVRSLRGSAVCYVPGQLPYRDGNSFSPGLTILCTKIRGHTPFMRTVQRSVMSISLNVALGSRDRLSGSADLSVPHLDHEVLDGKTVSYEFSHPRTELSAGMSQTHNQSLFT